MFRSLRNRRSMLALSSAGSSSVSTDDDDSEGNLADPYDDRYVPPQSYLTSNATESVFKAESDVGSDRGDESSEEEGAMSVAASTINRIIVPIVCAFGVLGIALTLVVLTRKTMRTSTNCYLIALSTADLVFLLLLGTILAEHHFAEIENKRLHNAIVIYGTYALVVTNVALMASVWMTVMLAVERYVAICRPFLATRVCTVRTSAIVITAVSIAAIACRLPNFWESRVAWYRDRSDPSNTSYVPYIESAELLFDHAYVSVYPWIVDGALTSIIPFAALVFLNASLVREVRRSTRYLQRHAAAGASSTQREELQISIMLIGIVVVFFICQAPYVIYSAVGSIFRDMEPTDGLNLFRAVAMLLITLKSAVNFIVYCWFSEKFWATLKRLLRCPGSNGDGSLTAGSLAAVLCPGPEGCCFGLCCKGAPGGGNGRRRDTYCSVRMQTTAIQLTAI